MINSINCHTSETSRFVYHHLQTLVKEIPSYIKDTKDFVKRINNFKVPENSFLVTMEVKALQLYVQTYQTKNVLLLSNKNTTTTQRKP